MENQPLFNAEGKLNPSITIVGELHYLNKDTMATCFILPLSASHVVVPGETMILNSIVLPNKHIDHGYKNEIIL